MALGRCLQEVLHRNIPQPDACSSQKPGDWNLDPH